MQHHSFRLLSDEVPQTEKQLTKQIDTTMKTRTKIIWICLGYLIFGAFAVDIELLCSSTEISLPINLS